MSGNSGSTIVRILAWCVLAPGLLTIVISVGTAARVLGVGATTAEGRVTGVSTGRLTDTQGRVRFRDSAVVEFTTRKGEHIEFVDPLGGAPVPYSKGSRVKVRYDESNPSDARILATSVLAVVMSSFGILGGLGFVALGGLLLLAAKLPWQVTDAGS